MSSWRDVPTSLAPDVLELHDADGAFERLEEWLRREGFFGPGASSSWPTSTSGTGSPTRSAAARAAAAEPCPLPLVACVVRPTTTMLDVVLTARARDRRVGADLVGVRLRGRRRAVRDAIARGDVYQVNLVQHLAAPFAGAAGALAARARAL